MNGIPKLANFDLSFHLDANRDITVLPDPSALRMTAIPRPSCLRARISTKARNLLAGVIAYELLVGASPLPRSSNSRLAAAGWLPSRSSVSPQLDSHAQRSRRFAMLWWAIGYTVCKTLARWPEHLVSPRMLALP